MTALALAALLAAFPGTGATVASSAPRMAPPAPDSTQTHYAQKNVEALRQLLRNADTRARRLLCRYRLYPLTEDARYLEGLPEDPPKNATARELALLAGLWGYRAAEASVFGVMQAGRRSTNLLDAARAEDPDDPFVLLVEGQSLLFRPALAGGSDEKALRRFRRLRDALDERPDAAIAPTEAALWTWYALRETDRPDAADALHQKLTARDLPPLYREFLKHPPG
jgi:hypothetical protein